MNRCTWSFCRFVLCALLGCCLAAPMGLAKSPEPAEKKEAPKTDAANDEMMQAMMKLAAPGEHHALLQPLAGKWKTITKAWMGPGDPEVTEGNEESTWVLGGRFLQDHFKGTFTGMPFEGYGMTGYDNGKKQFVSIWADTMGTGIMMMNGTADSAGKLLTFNGTYDDPTTGKPVTYKMVTKILDDSKHTFSMYRVADGKENLEMEITYTRM